MLAFPSAAKGVEALELLRDFLPDDRRARASAAVLRVPGVWVALPLSRSRPPRPSAPLPTSGGRESGELTAAIGVEREPPSPPVTANIGEQTSGPVLQAGLLLSGASPPAVRVARPTHLRRPDVRTAPSDERTRLPPKSRLAPPPAPKRRRPPPVPKRGRCCGQCQGGRHHRRAVGVHKRRARRVHPLRAECRRWRYHCHRCDCP